MSQTIIFDRSASGRVRGYKELRLIAIISSTKLRICERMAAYARMTELWRRTICRSDPRMTGLQHSHFDPFLQRTDR